MSVRRAVWLEAAGALDFYVLVDETNGPVGPIPFERVIRFTCADLEAAGLPMRFGRGWSVVVESGLRTLSLSGGSVPDYDYYLFVEYDCVVQCSLEEFVARAISQRGRFRRFADYAALRQWHWMPYQRDVYPAGEVKLALLNVCLFSSSALKLLHQRRLAMKADPSIRQLAE